MALGESRRHALHQQSDRVHDLLERNLPAWIDIEREPRDAERLAISGDPIYDRLGRAEQEPREQLFILDFDRQASTGLGIALQSGARHERQLSITDRAVLRFGSC